VSPGAPIPNRVIAAWGGGAVLVVILAVLIFTTAPKPVVVAREPGLPDNAAPSSVRLKNSGTTGCKITRHPRGSGQVAAATPLTRNGTPPELSPAVRSTPVQTTANSGISIDSQPSATLMLAPSLSAMSSTAQEAQRDHRVISCCRT